MFSKKNIILLWQGQLVSQLGTHFFNISRIVFLISLFDSGTYVGLLLAMSSLCAILFFPIGGYIADHYRNKTILIASDIVSACAMFLLAFSALYIEDKLVLTVSLFLISILVSASNSIFSTSMYSLVVKSVDKNNLLSANSSISSASQIAQVVGQALGGILLTLFNAPLLFLINGISFVLSAVTETFLDETYSTNNKKEKFSIIRGYKDSVSVGMKSIFDAPSLRYYFYYSFISGFTFMPIFVIAPYYTGLDESYSIIKFGGFMALLSAGMAVSMIILSRFKLSDNYVIDICKSALIRVFGCIIIFSSELLILKAIAIFLIGFGAAGESVKITSGIQRDCHSDKVGRTLSFVNLVNGALVPLSFLITGVVVDHITDAGKYFFIFNAISGICMIITSILWKKNHVNKSKKVTCIGKTSL